MTSIVPADKTARDDLAAKIIAARGLIDAPAETDAAIEFGVKIALDWLAVAQRTIASKDPAMPNLNSHETPAYPDCAECVELTETQNRLAREHNLPDFTTAPAWLDVHGLIWEWLGVATQADQFGPEWASGGSPWEPLRTADEWARHIDRDKLAEMLKRLDPLGDERCFASGEEYREYAAAVLAALPDLMGGAA